MKCFNIPGVYDHFNLNMFLLTEQKYCPQYFLPNTKISSIFGNFHFCIWDGGRNFVTYHQATKEEMLHIKDEYHHYDVAIRFVFTNPILQEEHLYDRFGNLQLQLFEDPKNEVVVNSPLMEEYIKDKYPSYKLISSTTKRITNKDKFLEELKKEQYFQVCLDYDLNKDMELIENIPQELRSKCEFLINAICHANCPQRKQHYAKTGKTQISYLREGYNIPGCTIIEHSLHPNVLGKGNNFTPEEIEKYHQMGYRYFKLEGRTLASSDILLMYMYYMIKPEYYFVFLKDAFSFNDETGERILFNDNNAHKRFILSPMQPRIYEV